MKGEKIGMEMRKGLLPTLQRIMGITQVVTNFMISLQVV
jgi:hypothetical protein